jgi:transcriptional regulator with XRE-family HTH domain
MRALARAAGVSAPYVNELEKGRSRAGLEVVGRLAAALQLPIQDLASLLEYRLPESTFEIAESIGTDITPDEASELRRLLVEMRSRGR